MELTNNAIAELREQVNIAYDTIAEKGGEVPEEKSLVNLPGAIGSIKQSTQEVEEKEVNFYDYKGNCIYSYTATEAMNLKELPPGPPDDEWVTFYGWSDSLEAINKGLPLNVGAYYDVVDPLKEGGWHAILLVKVCQKKVEFNSTVLEVDWGDGTIDSSYSHEYDTNGVFIVKIKAKQSGYSFGIYPNISLQNYYILRVHNTTNTDQYIGTRGDRYTFSKLQYYTSPNTADFEVLYQSPSMPDLKNITFKNQNIVGITHFNIGHSGYTHLISIVPQCETIGYWNSTAVSYSHGAKIIPHGITTSRLNEARSVIFPSTIEQLQFGYNAVVTLYTPIPPVLPSASGNAQVVVPIGSENDYKNATNYTANYSIIGAIPTEINTFTITADDVPANATTTTIHVKANLSMKAVYDDTMVPRDLERNVTSDAFDANTSSESREIEISFTMLGETRTCIITQAGVSA